MTAVVHITQDRERFLTNSTHPQAEELFEMIKGMAVVIDINPVFAEPGCGCTQAWIVYGEVRDIFREKIGAPAGNLIVGCRHHLDMD